MYITSHHIEEKNETIIINEKKNKLIKYNNKKETFKFDRKLETRKLLAETAIENHWIKSKKNSISFIIPRCINVIK